MILHGVDRVEPRPDFQLTKYTPYLAPLTLKWLGHFFLKKGFYFLVLFTLCAIFFYMKLVQYNEYLFSIVDTDGLVQ